MRMIAGARSGSGDQRGKTGGEGDGIVDARSPRLQLRIARDLAALQLPHLEQRHAAPQRDHARPCRRGASA